MTLSDFFLYCAIGGGALFVIQVVLQFGAGGGGGGDADADVDFDAGGEGHAHTHTSPDLSFKVLSLQGLTAFLLMFGLVGLALYRESRTGVATALIGASLGGFATTFLIARIFRAASKLQSSGTLDLQKAVGQTGSVYLGIAKGKPGKVTVAVASRLMTLDATSDGETFDTGTSVVIDRVLSDGTVVVRKA